jgi:hypothetical protein
MVFGEPAHGEGIADAGGRQQMKARWAPRWPAPRTFAAVGTAMLLAWPLAARASFLSPELADTAANYLAWFILIAMPIGGIVLFWLVHILPEKFAEKRHHPQTEAIQVLCLLSLVFGGLLWPVAWLWAFTKPTAYRAAYGTDKNDEYFVHMAERAQAGELSAHELRAVRDELDAVAKRGAMSHELYDARATVVAAATAAAAAAAPEAAPASASGAA